jgi:hypothetical protein
MKLIFYKAVLDADGRAMGERVVTIEDQAPRLDNPRAPVTARDDRLAYWRDFADFFEIL